MNEQIIVDSPQAWPHGRGPGLPGSLTPSDIVLLACDRFAPLPPGSTGLWARIGGEVDFAWPFALGLFFCVVLFCGESRDSAAEGLLLRCVAAAGAVALLAGYWWGRRRQDTASMMLPADAVFPLAGDRAALGEPLVAALVSAALLANERAGALRLELRDGVLQAEPTGDPAPWPADSLEDRIRRDRPNAVAGLVSDWLAHGSYSPHGRARRLAEHGAALRGLTAHSVGAAIDPAETLGLLQRCQDQRPEVWQALQQAVAEGVGARKVEPRYEQRGRMMVPVYDYQEPPVWQLDAPQAETAREVAPGATSAAGAGAGETKEPVFSRGQRLVPWIITSILAAGTAIRLLYFSDVRSEAWQDAPVAGLVIALSIAVLNRTARRHRRSGLAAASPHWTNEVLTCVFFGALFALIGALFGPGWMTAVLALFGWLWWGVWRRERALKAESVVEAVQSRLSALGTDRADTSSDGNVEVPNGPVSKIPTRLVAADDLPAPAGAERELLDRPAQRRRALRRTYWWGLATLIGGYSLIALPAELRLGDFPMGLTFAWGLTVMVSMYLYQEGAWAPAEDPDDDAPRPFLPALGITLWRLFALANLPLLDHKAFTLLALAFLAGHWLWMQWALARIVRRFPVPQPLRMSMLRVFGSPAFDDLIALIKPWRRVGVIEHLEGFDTIGESEEARAALRAGRIDDVLAKTGEEVERRLAAQSSAPDDTLLFGRYAFQCTEATWRPAIRRMLDRADVVLMDLSSLSPTNQGCAWELGLLLDRVPLPRVTLLVNDSTDLECLQAILDAAARRIAANSPNRDNATAVWQLVRIGGLAARLPHESHFAWKRRIDHRLDPAVLAGRLLATAQPPRAGATPAASYASNLMPPWARQLFNPWAWALLFALSAAWAAVRLF